MKPPDSSGTFRPFKDLEAMLKNRSFPLAPSPAAPETIPTGHPADPETESRQFLEAMSGVRKITCNKHFERRVASDLSGSVILETDSDADVLARLDDLVKYGVGFSVIDTPEYMAGFGHGVPPSMTDRLYRGDFSIQGHVDLHGLAVGAAKDAFDHFLKHAIKTEKRGVLIIHGRGLSSPSKPVLKGKVLEWLTRSTWRKWILAFSSARLCDGGAGATYVLLRKRPLTKSRMKINK